MPSDSADSTQDSAGGQFANHLIDLANERIGKGDDVQEIAAGLRHAAANFSAFAFFRQQQSRDPNDTVDAFASFFEHYLSVHQPAQAPGQGLAALIEQAKGEL